MKFYIKQKVFSFRDKFTVKDLESETQSLVKKGADLLISTNEYSLVDVRKEGNMMFRLSNL